jgi:hypothetical protein
MKKLKIKFFILIITISLVVSLLPFGKIGSTQINLSQVDELVQTLSETYLVNEEEIEDQIEKGYSLYDIQAALKLQRSTSDYYQTILKNRQPQAINISNQAASQFNSELSSINSSSVPIRFPGIKPKTIDPSSLLTSLMAKPNEAPYQVTSNNESISTISGGLTYQETDAFLPGRNGLSFSLTRTYNSQNSQENEMDVGISSNTNYYVHVPYQIIKQEKVYKAATIMKAYEEYDNNCDNTNDDIYDERTDYGSKDKQVYSEETYSSATSAEEHVFNSEIQSWSSISCEEPNSGGGEEMKIGTPANLTITKRTFNSITLTWDSVTKATEYNVYLNGAYKSFTDSTSFTFENLDENKEYTLGVSAVNKNDNTESPISETPATTKSSTGITLSKPIIDDKFSSTENTISISWNSVTHALGYNLYLDSNKPIYIYQEPITHLQDYCQIHLIL